MSDATGLESFLARSASDGAELAGAPVGSGAGVENGDGSGGGVKVTASRGSWVDADTGSEGAEGEVTGSCARALHEAAINAGRQTRR
jgi:hypothetical protein